jgi:ribonuclease HI
LKKIEIFTDGACSGNPGPGGWGAILKFGYIEKKISGAELQTTNNRMEMTALIEALQILKEPCEVRVYSDSKYLVDSVNKGWLKAWEDKQWKKSKNKPVLNTDLWKKITSLITRHKVMFFWVRGHAGHCKNEECDAMAVSAMKKMLSENFKAISSKGRDSENVENN